MSSSDYIAVNLQQQQQQGQGSIGSSSNSGQPNFRRRRSFPSASKPIGKIIPSFFRRLKLSQMDFELAFWQIMWLCIAPRRVYRNIYYHKQTKNQWARDDPAFFVIELSGIFIMSSLYSLVYQVGFLGFLKVLLWMVFIDYILVGIIMATIGWFVSNKFLVSHHIVQSNEQSVEWFYCFDIHCNAFVPIFFFTYVLQFFFLAILSREYAISRLLGNTLYFAASLYYIYITYLGYAALPFLHRTIIVLYPAVLVTGFYFISLFGIHISYHILEWYFHN